MQLLEPNQKERCEKLFTSFYLIYPKHYGRASIPFFPLQVQF